MDRMIYTAMTGANAAAARQAVLSNNLANASTNGFRAELSTFRAVPVRGDGASTRVMALEATSGELDTPGAAQRTGRNLDAMTVGKAWFGLQAPASTEIYTGPLILNSDYTAEEAEADVTSGKCDAVSFGRAFIANPDLVERIAAGAPLAKPDYSRLYTGEDQGYTDYPTLAG